MHYIDSAARLCVVCLLAAGSAWAVEGWACGGGWGGVGCRGAPAHPHAGL
jgi:hypothetical protein